MVQKLWHFLLILVKDFFTFGIFRNLNLTSESPQISTRWSQTPDVGIWPLCCNCCTQEVFDDSQFSIQWQYRREPNICALYFRLDWVYYRMTEKGRYMLGASRDAHQISSRNQPHYNLKNLKSWFSHEYIGKMNFS